MTEIRTYPAPDLALRQRLVIGEGPFIDPRDGVLHWVDLQSGELYRRSEATGDGGAERLAKLDCVLGAAVPRQSVPGYAAAVSDGFGLIEGGALRLVDPVLHEPYRRMNDGKCDARGRFWAGSTHIEYHANVGALHCWDPAAGARSLYVCGGLTLPNGLGWDADNRWMVLADSFGKVLLKAEFDLDTGHVGPFAPIHDFASGLPDGLAVDVEGCAWVAVWDGAEVLRIAPDGRAVGRIPMPVAKPSSCAFGPGGVLYITSASIGEDAGPDVLAGSLFVLDVGVEGVPVAGFAG